MVITLKSNAILKDVIYHVDRLTEPFGGSGAYDRSDQASHHRVADEIKQTGSMAFVTPSIFLAVSTFLFNIVLSRLVDHQKEQIATLRAFGYGRREIGFYYVKLLVALVTIGAVIGCLAGVPLSRWMTNMYVRFFRFPTVNYEFAMVYAILATLIGFGAAAAGSFVAIRRAMRLPPAVAMRPEAPPTFKPSILERIGLQRFISPLGRMIVRRLQGNRRATILSVLGMAMGLAVVVLGSFFEDTIDYVMDVQFERAQRQDVMLTFYEARSISALHDAEHLPGVISAEPFRTVAVRLRHGTREHRLGIMGLDSKPRLYRVLDDSEYPVEFPPQSGLTISKKLSEILEIQVGEKLTVDVLEGRRGTYEMRVAAIFPDYTDPGAYLNRRELHRLLGEGERLSGAFLLADPARMDEMYASVKQTPAIAGVLDKNAAMKNFESAIADNTYVMRIMNAAFAWIISFGVIYNCADNFGRTQPRYGNLAYHGVPPPRSLLHSAWRTGDHHLAGDSRRSADRIWLCLFHHAGHRHRDTPVSLSGQSRHFCLFNLCYSRGGRSFVALRSPQTGPARFDCCNESERVMKKILSKIPWIVIGLGLIALLVYGFWPQPVEVDVVEVKQGSLDVTVNDDGETRIREKYLISAPVNGKMLRVQLDAGDVVKQGVTELARIEPSDLVLLDARTQAEYEARVRAAEASLEQANTAVHRAKEALELADHDYERVQRLVDSRAISRIEFDAAEHRQHIAEADLNSAKSAAKVAQFELETARVALARFDINSGQSTTEPVRLVSPIDGQVLRVFQEDAGVVAPGTALLELGDPLDLEIEIDVLSTDAVRIQPGDKVFVEHWGGSNPLEAVVRLVEPSAFLKISALGVEEKRVNVIADFVDPPSDRVTLGDGFRIEARIVVESTSEDSIKVASGSLFRNGDAWFVYRIANGIAEQCKVVPGQTNGLDTEINNGLSAGDFVILHPTEKIRHGVSVKPSE